MMVDNKAEMPVMDACIVCVNRLTCPAVISCTSFTVLFACAERAFRHRKAVASRFAIPAPLGQPGEAIFLHSSSLEVPWKTNVRMSDPAKAMPVTRVMQYN